MKTKTFNLGYDLNGLYRTRRLLFCFTPAAAPSQEPQVKRNYLTIAQFIRITHLLLSSHAPQKDKTIRAL